MAPRVILIGPMGSGKTTIGSLLAEKLGLAFRDTDHLIEEREEKPVSQIFLDQGEDAFRAIEKRVLRDELHTDGTVLSLGGGAPISIDAQSALRAISSYIIFLDISLSTVVPRIGFNRDRPLLLNNPRGQWQTLMEARRPIYEALADVTINVDDKSEEEIVNIALSSLEEAR
jgi:shikimate kinase|uniref:shikimate kinase n=1 Tax=Candidatus Planktophila sp. TaxID=2175601 RepID=UPI00404AECAE